MDNFKDTGQPTRRRVLLMGVAGAATLFGFGKAVWGNSIRAKGGFSHFDARRDGRPVLD